MIRTDGQKHDAMHNDEIYIMTGTEMHYKLPYYRLISHIKYYHEGGGPPTEEEILRGSLIN